MSPLTNYEAWKARALFEAAKYGALVRAADSRAPEGAAHALWLARALTEEDRFEAAERILAPFARELPEGRERAYIWAQIGFARLMRGLGLEPVEAAVSQAAAEGAPAPAALLRALIAMAIVPGHEAVQLIAAIPPCEDPYFQQMRVNTTIATASSAGDETRLAAAIAALPAHLAAQGGLHYLGWSLFSLARAQYKMGWQEQGRATLLELDGLFALGFGARLRRAVALLREAAEDKAAIDFCPVGKNHCETVPRAFPTAVAAHTQLPGSLAKRPMLAQLYATLLAAGDAGMTKDDLFRHLWGSNYDPTRHEARLYKALARLREALQTRGDDALVAVGARYLIKESTSHAQ